MNKDIDRMVVIATIAISLAISLADLFGLLDNVPWLADRLPAVILVLLAMLAIHLVSEQRENEKRLGNLHDLMANFGLEATSKLSTEDAFIYISERFAKAERTIDQTATAPSIKPDFAYDRYNYNKALSKMLKANKVNYRYIAMFDETRWKRTREFLRNAGIERYNVRYFDRLDNGVPSLNFIVIDGQEVIIRYPYASGEREFFVCVKHPQVVELFCRHFDSMWGKAQLLDRGYTEVIERLDREWLDHASVPG